MEDIAKRLNAVVEYIEKHLTEEPDKAQIARIAKCSFYDVGRTFSLIAEISIADYIRRRRLTLAGAELKYDGAKVLDTALKYGYDSPSSFARAFMSFHGFNPGLAARADKILHSFPKLLFTIEVKGIQEKMRTEVIKAGGKEYAASYLGEKEMASWSVAYMKRRYWRLENAHEDFKNAPKTTNVLPYNNYPPIEIQIGDVFLIDYYRKSGEVEQKYYIADGTIWQGLQSTHEFIPDFMASIRTDILTVKEKEYEADYFGAADMSEWSTAFRERRYWRLKDPGKDFENVDKLSDVLPYNNYPPIDFRIGDVFVIDYVDKNGRTERKYYIADGTVWQNMICTRQFFIKE